MRKIHPKKLLPSKHLMGRFGHKARHIGLALQKLLQRIPTKTYKWAGIGAFSLLLLLCSASFLWPRTVQFSVAKPSCFFNPTLFPGLVQVKTSQTFSAQPKPTFSIGNLPIYSATTCITPVKAPLKTSVETVVLHFGFLPMAKHITIKAAAAPAVTSTLKADQPVATKGPLQFRLAHEDTVFSYSLQANDKQVLCQVQQKNLSCQADKLELTQSTDYSFTLQRTFQNQVVDTTFSQTARTVEAAQVIDANVKPGEKLFGIPTSLAFRFNKPLAQYKDVTLEHVGAGPIATINRIEDSVLVLELTQPLPRNSLFKLAINQVEAHDRATLLTPYTFEFITSAGPQVTNAGIGTSRVDPNAGFNITFDSPLAPNQPIQNFIKLESGGAPIGAKLSIQGNRVTVTPEGLPRCRAFSIQVLDGIQNEAGVTGGSAWKFSSRTICQTIIGIGASAKGRGITGYKFGTGSSTIVISGSIHGNERSAAATLHSFIADLEANADRIPAHRTIIVIPVVNPDGYATGSRTNANNVDLNRNFPANNWKPHVIMPNGSTLENGGGPTPLSEPESRALANFTLAQNPRLVLTYHAIAPLVAANEAGDSRALASIYGSKAGWSSYGNEAGGDFAYDTTGAYEDWLRDKYGIPAILIEQATMTSNEYVRQKNALWTMVQLP